MVRAKNYETTFKFANNTVASFFRTLCTSLFRQLCSLDIPVGNTQHKAVFTDPAAYLWPFACPFTRNWGYQSTNANAVDDVLL